MGVLGPVWAGEGSVSVPWRQPCFREVGIIRVIASPVNVKVDMWALASQHKPYGSSSGGGGGGGRRTRPDHAPSISIIAVTITVTVPSAPASAICITVIIPNRRSRALPPSLAVSVFTLQQSSPAVRPGSLTTPEIYSPSSPPLPRPPHLKPPGDQALHCKSIHLGCRGRRTLCSGWC